MIRTIKNVSNLTIWFAVLFSLSIAIATGVSISILRDKEIKDWSQQASSTVLILAENTAQQMTTGYLALDGIVERVNARAPANDMALRKIFGTEAIFQMMTDKAASSPQIDVATIVASDGEVINFTRKWPAPKINLAERDYFKAHRDNPKLDVLISDPVRNKGNGKWTFYLSRRLNDPLGNFIGLVLLGISTDYYSDFYQRINQGNNAVITLLRDDFTIMARWPVREDMLGKRNLTGSTHVIINDQQRNEGVLITSAPRLASNEESGHTRLGAVRKVQKYPLIVNYTIEEDVYLGSWKESARLIALWLAAALLQSSFHFGNW